MSFIQKKTYETANAQRACSGGCVGYVLLGAQRVGADSVVALFAGIIRVGQDLVHNHTHEVLVGPQVGVELIKLIPSKILYANLPREGDIERTGDVRAAVAEISSNRSDLAYFTASGVLLPEYGK